MSVRGDEEVIDTGSIFCRSSQTVEDGRCVAQETVRMDAAPKPRCAIKARPPFTRCVADTREDPVLATRRALSAFATFVSVPRADERRARRLRHRYPPTANGPAPLYVRRASPCPGAGRR